MSDPRLNSIHLEPRRREEFRRAREALVNAVGDQTRRADQSKDPAAASNVNTLLTNVESRIPPGLDYALMEKDAVYQLKVGLNTIGRLTDNDVIIPDPYLSRRHCAILVHVTKGCELHDVASKNGTFVNGRKINGPTPIVSGDEIQMCDHQLIFVCKSDYEENGPTAPSNRSGPSNDHTFVE